MHWYLGQGLRDNKPIIARGGGVMNGQTVLTNNKRATRSVSSKSPYLFVSSCFVLSGFKFEVIFMDVIEFNLQPCQGPQNGSSIGIATGYGLVDQGSISGKGKRSFSSPQRPDRHWGLPSLLSNKYRGLNSLG
jgi:hypothetical protein